MSDLMILLIICYGLAGLTCLAVLSVIREGVYLGDVIPCLFLGGIVLPFVIVFFIINWLLGLLGKSPDIP